MNFVNEITCILLNRYEKKFFQLAIPECFDSLKVTDNSVEIVVSSTLQPLYLLYKHNAITMSECIIFFNS